MNCFAGNGSKHLNTRQLLEYALSQKMAGNTTLTNPTGLLWWYLLMPFVFFMVGQLIAELLQVFVGWYVGS